MPATTRQHADPGLIGCALALGGAALGIIAAWLPLMDPESQRRAHPREPVEHLLLGEDLPAWLLVGVAIACAVSVILALRGRRPTRGPTIAGIAWILLALFAGSRVVMSSHFGEAHGTVGPGVGVYAGLVAGLLMLLGGLLTRRSSRVDTLVAASTAGVLVALFSWLLTGSSAPAPGYEDLPVAAAPGLTLSEYANHVADHCRSLGVEDLASYFGVAPTAEDAARAVYPEDLERPWSDAAYEGCLRGFGVQR